NLTKASFIARLTIGRSNKGLCCALSDITSSDISFLEPSLIRTSFRPASRNAQQLVRAIASGKTSTRLRSESRRSATPQKEGCKPERFLMKAALSSSLQGSQLYPSQE